MINQIKEDRLTRRQTYKRQKDIQANRNTNVKQSLTKHIFAYLGGLADQQGQLQIGDQIIQV